MILHIFKRLFKMRGEKKGWKRVKERVLRKPLAANAIQLTVCHFCLQCLLHVMCMTAKTICVQTLSVSPSNKSCCYVDCSAAVVRLFIFLVVSVVPQVSNPSCFARTDDVVQARGCSFPSLQATRALSDEMWKTAHNDLEHSV